MKHGFLSKARYLSSVSTLYIVTFALLWHVILPILPARIEAQTFGANLPTQTAPKVFNKIEPIITYGMPKNLLVSKSSIDKEVFDGEYHEADKSWTLNSNAAFYALITSMPNDYGGLTMIYGHNNKDAFGPLSKLVPGDKAVIITDNNLRFTYSFINAENYSPDDTSIFHYEGPPILALQTCSGRWNEIRRMYTFNFEKVEKI